MFAWSKSTSPHAVDLAKALLCKMIEPNKNGVLDSRPDAASYNILIHTILRRKMNYYIRRLWPKPNPWCKKLWLLEKHYTPTINQRSEIK
jgi:hypothetical protein